MVTLCCSIVKATPRVLLTFFHKVDRTECEVQMFHLSNGCSTLGAAPFLFGATCELRLMSCGPEPTSQSLICHLCTLQVYSVTQKPWVPAAFVAESPFWYCICHCAMRSGKNGLYNSHSYSLRTVGTQIARNYDVLVEKQINHSKQYFHATGLYHQMQIIHCSMWCVEM